MVTIGGFYIFLQSFLRLRKALFSIGIAKVLVKVLPFFVV